MNYQEIILEIMLITEETFPDAMEHNKELLKLVWLLSAHYDEY